MSLHCKHYHVNSYMYMYMYIHVHARTVINTPPPKS